MSNKKLEYKTPNAWIVKMAPNKAMLTASMGATLPGVTEEEMDYDF